MVIIEEMFETDDIDPQIFRRRADYRPLHEPRQKAYTQIQNTCLKCGGNFYTETFSCDICPDCAWEVY
jgi:hypothetical protein